MSERIRGSYDYVQYKSTYTVTVLKHVKSAVIIQV